MRYVVMVLNCPVCGANMIRQWEKSDVYYCPSCGDYKRLDVKVDWLEAYKALVDEVASQFRGEEFNSRVEKVLKIARTVFSPDEYRRLEDYASSLASSPATRRVSSSR